MVNKGQKKLKLNEKIVLVISIIVLLSTITVISRPSAATSGTTDHYRLAGYEGNNSIYMSSDVTNDYDFPEIHSSFAIQSVNQNDFALRNAVAIGVAPNATSTNGGVNYHYVEYDNEGNLYLQFPLIAFGAANLTWDSYDTYGSAVDGLILGMNTSRLPLNTVLQGYPGFNSGVNVTGQIAPGYDYSAALNQTIIYLLGFVPYLGYAIGTEQYIQGLISDERVQNIVNDTYNTSEQYVVNGGTQSGTDPASDHNVYSGIYMVLLTIPPTDFSTPGTVTLYAENLIQGNGDFGISHGTGARTTLNLSAVPAYTIQGYINSNGNPAANQEIELASSSGNNYILHTNSNGYYRFFSNPSSTYKLEVPSSSYGAKSVLPADGSTGGTWANLSLNSITFSKTSNVYNEKWSATISGGQTGSQSLSTTGNSITFDVFGNTSYSFSIGDPTGYSASPSTGSINLGSTAYTQSISFSPTVTYSATFSESGLPSGQTWSVKLDGNSKSASAGSSISFTVSDGSHSYSVPYDYYSTTLWYEPTTNGGGTFPINGGGTSIAVTFTGVPQSTTSCVYALAPVLLSNYTTQYAQNIKVGNNIMTYNFSTGTMQQGTVQQVFITHHTEMYVINGYLKVAGDQDIWTNHGYIQAQNLTSNDTIYNVFDNHYYRVHSVSVEYGNFTMYDFYVTANHNYIVWSNLMQDRLP